MKKLADLDDFYKTVITKLPLIDRLYYCQAHYNFAKDTLEKRIVLADAHLKTQLQNMRDASDKEVQALKQLLLKDISS